MPKICSSSVGGSSDFRNSAAAELQVDSSSTDLRKKKSNGSGDGYYKVVQGDQLAVAAAAVAGEVFPLLFSGQARLLPGLFRP